MDYIEVEGKTYEEAVRRAAEGLNVDEKDLDIEVREVDTKGILGFLGGKKIRITARLRVEKQAEARPVLTKENPPAEQTVDEGGAAPEEYAAAFLQDLGRHMDLAVSTRATKLDNRIIFSLQVDKAEALIGRDGETLEAIQYLLKLAMAKRFKHGHKVIVDINGYRDKRQKALTIMAKRLADKAKKSKRSQKTKPLNPYERRIIHTLFKNNRSITTKSEGDGHTKQVVISPSGTPHGRR